MLYILIFVILAYLIIRFGSKLGDCGDAIGDIKGIDKSWIGVVMLAGITSLPELITGVSATLLGKPEMAISNIFGSNIFNIFIIFILDVFILKEVHFSSKVHKKNMLTGFFSIILSSIFILGHFFKALTIGYVSIFSIIIIVCYSLFMKMLHLYETEYEHIYEEEEVEEEKELMTYTAARNGFIINAILVIIVGVLISWTADKIAVTPIFGIRLGESFVGLLLLALATSLPELTISIRAVKLGSYDMAAGNILGSNLFNLAIIFVINLFTFKGGFYARITTFHLTAALFSIIMVMVFLVGMVFNKKKRSYDGILIGILYVVSMYVLYRIR
jgi:cation:H+ antiporter